jgi:hypothetical protein
MANKLTIYIPGIVMVLYAITGSAFLYKKDYAWALVWFSYALANLGLILAGNK